MLLFVIHRRSESFVDPIHPWWVLSVINTLKPIFTNQSSKRKIWLRSIVWLMLFSFIMSLVHRWSCSKALFHTFVWPRSFNFLCQSTSNLRVSYAHWQYCNNSLTSRRRRPHTNKEGRCSAQKKLESCGLNTVNWVSFWCSFWTFRSCSKLCFADLFHKALFFFFSEIQGGLEYPGAFSLNSFVLSAPSPFIVSSYLPTMPFPSKSHPQLIACRNMSTVQRSLPAGLPDPGRPHTAVSVQALPRCLQASRAASSVWDAFPCAAEHIHTQPSTHGTNAISLSEANFLSTL